MNNSELQYALHILYVRYTGTKSMDCLATSVWLSDKISENAVGEEMQLSTTLHSSNSTPRLMILAIGI